ncbi:MAG: hypothetical protein JNL74_04870 [Fibrobacteres bacterium]|nr:hypothetical protein [Fibrobacterota bacterium]
MRDKVYITIIALLAGVAVFFFLSHKRDCRMLEDCSAGCAQNEQGSHQGKGRGMGMGQGMGFGMNAGREVSEARKELFTLITSGCSDTALLFTYLEKIVDVQRDNQKRTLLKILSIRDSLKGNEKEAYINNLNQRFCGQSGRGCGVNRQRE